MPSIATVLKAAVLFLPAIVAASGSLGFSLGIHKDSDATCKTTNDFISDLKKIKAETGSNVVRIYTTSDCDALKTLGAALKATGSKAIIGIWPTPADHFVDELKALTDYLPQYKDQVIGVTVGSEHLYRKDLTGKQLADLINKTKNSVKALGLDTPIGFADSWNLFADGTGNEAVLASDLILANAFSYWQGQKSSNGTASFFDDIMQALDIVQKVKGTTDIPFWVGETNWPTGGANFKNAVPNVANSAAYWKDAVCGMLGWGVNVFVFEAFDEPWKPTAEGQDGIENTVEQHWGVMTVEGKPKFDLTC